MSTEAEEGPPKTEVLQAEQSVPIEKLRAAKLAQEELPAEYAKLQFTPAEGKMLQLNRKGNPLWLHPDEPQHGVGKVSERADYIPDLFKTPTERESAVLAVEKGYENHPMSKLLDEIPPRGASWIRGHITKALLQDKKESFEKIWWRAVEFAKKEPRSLSRTVKASLSKWLTK